MSRIIFRPEDLKEYVVRFFCHYGVSEEDARIAAEILVAADLRGVDSHGVIRLDTYYGTRLRSGKLDPLTPVKVLQETLTTVAYDAGTGLGQVAGYRAMQRCIEKAREVGLSMATVRNSNHYGIAGYYAMMALPHDMIGISFTNSQPLVAPTYGRTAILGTNPIAVAAPAGHNRPYVLDMATSIVPIGRVTVYQKAGKPIPEGWGVNKEGSLTTDPNEVIQGGALMALGGSDIMRGYKGYGLSLLVDIFSGILSGSSFGKDVGHPNDDRPADVGHFFAAIRIDAFRPAEEFKRDLDALLDQLKSAPKAIGQERIYIHGEKEFELYDHYIETGVPLMSEVVNILTQTGQKVGVPFDLQPVGELP
ncbi:MAG: Ldh family oxidoreductase [Anaerolineaceae bacterium]|nr:Ldh family oxidoreductase [Anaerolineaceae bacterium]